MDAYTKPPMPLIGYQIDWSDEGLFAVLSEAYREGLSATQIMFRIHDRFNVPFTVRLTRNAVLGALHRSKLGKEDRPAHHPTRSTRTAAKDAKRARKARSQVSTEKMKRLRAECEQRDQSVEQQALNAAKGDALEVREQYGDLEPWERVSLPFKANGRATIVIEHLTDKTCRWPFECDDGYPGEHTYCGDPVVQGTQHPYCAMHTVLASGGMPQVRASSLARPSWRGRREI